jgi:hypothetical protein
MTAPAEQQDDMSKSPTYECAEGEREREPYSKSQDIERDIKYRSGVFMKVFYIHE